MNSSTQNRSRTVSNASTAYGGVGVGYSHTIPVAFDTRLVDESSAGAIVDNRALALTDGDKNDEEFGASSSAVDIVIPSGKWVAMHVRVRVQQQRAYTATVTVLSEREYFSIPVQVSTNYSTVYILWLLYACARALAATTRLHRDCDGVIVTRVVLHFSAGKCFQ
jgi:hypothetical protein